MYLRLLFSFITFLSFTSLFAQGLGNAPYSRLGVGDYKLQQGSVRNIGMGGAGLASKSVGYINWINPASLSNYKGKREDSIVKIDVGFGLQYKWLKDQSTTNGDFGLNIQHIVIQFPISKTMNGAIGLLPLTSVQNNFTSQVPVNNAPSGTNVNYNYKGSGGIYNLGYSMGWGVTKNVAIGLSASALFGSIKQEATSQVILDPNNPTNQKKVGTYDQNTYSGFLFRPSFIIKQPVVKHIYSNKQLDTMNLTDEMKKHRRSLLMPQSNVFSFAGSFDIYTPAHANQTTHYIEKDLLDKYTIDSTIGKSAGRVYLPFGARFGVAYEKPGKWGMYLDYTFSNWSAYKNSEIKSATLNNSFMINVGGEWVKMNEDKPARSVTYRAGLYYGKSHYTVIGSDMYDRGVTFGASFPVGSTAGNRFIQPMLTKLNTGVVIGQLMPQNDLLIKETYIRLYLSMNIYSGWYGKRRIH
ncbi:MAG: hypothetical protein U0U66_14055 [Cytophagaceae bacterium]